MTTTQRPLWACLAAATLAVLLSACHQAAPGSRSTTPCPTRPTPPAPSPITSALDKALAWQERSGCPPWLGEFGVHNAADQDSRVNWTRFVRQEAEARGIPWAAWEFGTNFNLYDRRAGRWNEELLEALLPSE